ncbi:hypothetical protein BaRGS_00000501 [Batillaria attramentaria]|uniref:Uncharacterized protein n=1 Tax=Batillaria attramentaria TaxID=370345 RepID=A0ABD0M955_9CAEN
MPAILRILQWSNDMAYPRALLDIRWGYTPPRPLTLRHWLKLGHPGCLSLSNPDVASFRRLHTAICRNNKDSLARLHLEPLQPSIMASGYRSEGGSNLRQLPGWGYCLTPETPNHRYFLVVCLWGGPAKRLTDECHYQWKSVSEEEKK